MEYDNKWIMGPGLSAALMSRACAGLVITLLEYFRKSMMSRLIAANQTLKAGFPQGYPEGLLVRGLGQAMEAALDKLGDKRENELTGHVVLVTDTVTREILGPKFCLRGPPVDIGFRPKQLWGEGTKVNELNHVTLNV